MHNLHFEGLRHAEAKLKDLVRASHAERTTESGPLGDQILEAVEALPDYDKFKKLSDDTRAKLEEVLVKFEIQHHADAVIKAFDKIDKIRSGQQL